jgi:hypothetical protein
MDKAHKANILAVRYRVTDVYVKLSEDTCMSGGIVSGIINVNEGECSALWLLYLFRN